MMKLAILIVLMVSTLGLKLQAHVQEEESQFHTIIVGAGMAGMAAASQLAKKGHSVLVLEANDYIGGRLKTKPIKLSDNSTFQFQEGANWIHGSNPDHPITKLSQKISGFKYATTDDEQILNYLVDGTQVDEQVDAQNEPYEELQEQMMEMQNVSIYDAFNKLDPSKLTNKYFMSLVSHDIEFQTASPINEVSAQYALKDSAYDGQEALVVSGYQRFAEYLGKTSKIKVLLNHKVTSVKYDDGTNKVSCQNGKNFSSEYVIIAVPLGVLKAKTIQFEPRLPSQKLDAIQKLHFGGVCKVLVILKKKLQVQKQHYIAVIPDSVQERGKAAYFVNLQGLVGIPALMTFGLGPNADEIEKMLEDQLKELIASRISAFSNEQFSEDDIEIARSTWSTNPNFRGAYSAAGVYSQPKHWQDMAEPVLENKWFFSGEHTISNHRATVHGAYESGVKAANDIDDQSNVQEDDSDE